MQQHSVAGLALELELEPGLEPVPAGNCSWLG